MSKTAGSSSRLDKDHEQLKMLFDYTKFHIGLYTSVATIFGAAIAVKDGRFDFDATLLLSSIFFICLAGFAGGIIASSATQFQSYSEFWGAQIGPCRFKSLTTTTERWSYIEHGSFWAAIGCAVVAVIVK